MPDLGGIIDWVDIAAREATLFACAGFLLGGLDDLAVDLLFWLGVGARRIRVRPTTSPTLASLPAPVPTRLVVFVPAWQEAGVIAPMLETALARIAHDDYAIYVGTYPNDPATVDAVALVAERDSRVRLVIGAAAGPTTKAGCLNTLWHAMLRDETAGVRPALAVILHDAEDLVHPDELRLHAALIPAHDLVQIPVLPLVDPKSRFIAGHYVDEFAESHGKSLPVRGALGAGLPLSGVGCAIRRDMLARIAEARGDGPFDADSMTEDYELGLTVKKLGGRPVFARIAEHPGGPPVAVRALFPATLDAAVRQKARWMTGIALAGWDRVGWSRRRHLGDHWMRMRDRRALVAVLVLASAYGAIMMNGLSWALHRLVSAPAVATSPAMHLLLIATMALLGWRMAMRALFVGRSYGIGQAALSIPRAVVGNIIALMAARRAVIAYIGMLRGKRLTWDKTDHRFPSPATRPRA